MDRMSAYMVLRNDLRLFLVDFSPQDLLLQSEVHNLTYHSDTL